MAHHNSVLCKHLLLPFICLQKNIFLLSVWMGGIGGCFLSGLHLDLHGASMWLHTKKLWPLLLNGFSISQQNISSQSKPVPFFFSSHKKQKLYYFCNIKYMSFSTNTSCPSSHVNHFKCCSQESLLLRGNHDHSGFQLFNIRAHWYLHTLIGILHHL